MDTNTITQTELTSSPGSDDEVPSDDDQEVLSDEMLSDEVSSDESKLSLDFTEASANQVNDITSQGKSLNENFTPPSEDIHAGVGLSRHPLRMGFNTTYRRGYNQAMLIEQAENEADQAANSENANVPTKGFYKAQAYRLVPWLRKAQYDKQEWKDIKTQFIRYYERTGTSTSLNDSELENRIVSSLDNLYFHQFNSWRTKMKLTNDNDFDKWWKTLGGDAQMMDDGTVVMPNGWRVTVGGTICTPTGNEASDEDLEQFFEHLSNEQLEEYIDDGSDNNEESDELEYDNKNRSTLRDCMTGTYYKNSDAKWYTNKVDKERTFESHASFMNDVVDQLTMENANAAKFEQMCEFEDHVHARLSDISTLNNRKWTFRFIIKRMKPKIINFLHRERLELLQLYLDEDWEQWKFKEFIYSSIALRNKLHLSAAYQWKDILMSYKKSVNQCERFLFPFRVEFTRELQHLERNNNIEHFNLIIEALNDMFPQPTDFSEFTLLSLMNPINPLNELTERSKRNKPSWYTQMKKQNTESDETNDEDVGSDSEIVESEAISVQTFDMSEFPQDESKYPNSQQIQMVIDFLKRALDRHHSTQLWKHHEKVYNCDEDCELGIARALQLFNHVHFEDGEFALTKISDFDQWVEKMLSGETKIETESTKINNGDHEIDSAKLTRHSGYNNGTNPLRNVEIINFHQLIKDIIDKRHQANHYRRMICALFPALLPDWEASDLRTTQVLLSSQLRWMENILHNHTDPELYINDEQWQQIQDTVSENSSKQTDKTKLTLDKKVILPNMVKDTDDLIEDEIPEIDRLTKRQIMKTGDFMFFTVRLKVFDHNSFNNTGKSKTTNAFQHFDLNAMTRIQSPKKRETKSFKRSSIASRLSSSLSEMFVRTPKHSAEVVQEEDQEEEQVEVDMFSLQQSAMLDYNSSYQSIGTHNFSKQPNLEESFFSMMYELESMGVDPMSVKVTATTQDQLIISRNAVEQENDTTNGLHQTIDEDIPILMIDLQLCDQVYFMYDQTQQILIQQGSQVVCLVAQEQGSLKTWENALIRL